MNEKQTIEDVKVFLDENFGENDWLKAIEKFGLELCEEALNIHKPSEEEMKVNMDAYFVEMKRIQDETSEINNEAIEYVKGMINYDFENIKDYLDGNDWWRSIDYIEIEKSDYKNCFYPSYDFYIEKNADKILHYMRQDDNTENTFHSLVWQQDGGYGTEDSYNGFILFPLTDGRYWKIRFEC